MPKDKQLALICASGYRSTIAMGILERARFIPPMNVVGGTGAWKGQGYDVVSEVKAESEPTTAA